MGSLRMGGGRTAHDVKQGDEERTSSGFDQASERSP